MSRAAQEEPQPCSSRSLREELRNMRSGGNWQDVDHDGNGGGQGRQTGGQDSDIEVEEVYNSRTAKAGRGENGGEGAEKKKAKTGAKKEKLSQVQKEKQITIRKELQRLMEECSALSEVKSYLRKAIRDMENDMELVQKILLLSRAAEMQAMQLTQMGLFNAFNRQVAEIEGAANTGSGTDGSSMMGGSMGLDEGYDTQQLGSQLEEPVVEMPVDDDDFLYMQNEMTHGRPHPDLVRELLDE